MLTWYRKFKNWTVKNAPVLWGWLIYSSEWSLSMLGVKALKTYSNIIKMGIFWLSNNINSLKHRITSNWNQSFWKLLNSQKIALIYVKTEFFHPNSYCNWFLGNFYCKYPTLEHRFNFAWVSAFVNGVLLEDSSRKW